MVTKMKERLLIETGRAYSILMEYGFDKEDFLYQEHTGMCWRALTWAKKTVEYVKDEDMELNLEHFKSLNLVKVTPAHDGGYIYP